MNNTKDQIIDFAIKLFNDNGFKNVTLKQIALEVGISNGNLNYHFKKKDDLMLSIFHRMEERKEKILQRFKSYPDLTNIIEQINIFYHFQIEFRFFYLDTLEIFRAYPKIANAYQIYMMNALQHIRSSIDYCVGRGVFEPEPFPQAYDFLAHTIWLKGAFWLVKTEVLQKAQSKPDEFINSFVSLWYPYLTESGRKELTVARELNITENITNKL